MLKYIEREFAVYSPYWFYRARSAQDAGDTDEASSCFRKFRNIWRPVLRKDPYKAEALKFRIDEFIRAGVHQEETGKLMIQNLLDEMRSNTPLEDWANNIYMGLMYFTLGEKAKAKECVMCNIDFRFETESSSALLAKFESKIPLEKPVAASEAVQIFESGPESVQDAPQEEVKNDQSRTEAANTPEAPDDEKHAKSSRNNRMVLLLIILLILFIQFFWIWLTGIHKNSTSIIHSSSNVSYTADELPPQIPDDIRKGIRQGDADAQNRLGNAYYFGNIVSKDHKEAVKWYRLSAEQGNANGQCNLGTMYYYGRGGLPKSDNEAVKWYRLSAEQGNAQGQCNLGIMYEYGKGVKQNKKEAILWYRKAAVQDNTAAQDRLKKLGETW